jgi:hypothetical protein
MGWRATASVSGEEVLDIVAAASADDFGVAVGVANVVVAGIGNSGIGAADVEEPSTAGAASVEGPGIAVAGVVLHWGACGVRCRCADYTDKNSVWHGGQSGCSGIWVVTTYAKGKLCSSK